MNLPKLLLRHAPSAFALFAGLFLVPAGRAQPEPQIADNRFLFIFDTSADMKKRLPAVQAEVNQLMSASLGGRLKPGDSVGVWTFDQDLHFGQFQLQSWRPENAMTIAAGINKFLGRQHYANNTRFSALQPQLNQVIQTSGRLTVLIFCDGEDEINWTPYDARINQVFQQRVAEQKRTRQPFVLIFRMQLGQYTGCTMNFPPGMVNIPDFPPPPAPPAPPAPVKTPAAEPPPAPAIKPPIGSPLVIIGKKVETNWPPETGPMTPKNAIPAPATNGVAPTNPVAPSPPNPVPVVQTHAAPVPPAVPFAPTNPIAPETPVTPPSAPNAAPVIHTKTNDAPAPAVNPPGPTSRGSAPTNFAPVPESIRMAPTNAVAQSPETSGPAHQVALAIGGVLLIAAGGLAALAVFRSRRTGRGSLITRSMRKD